jgi:hypothetical protein
MVVARAPSVVTGEAGMSVEWMIFMLVAPLPPTRVVILSAAKDLPRSKEILHAPAGRSE